jgi:hypothetical protein
MNWNLGNCDPLAVHRAVMAAAGPEAVAGITRPLTAAEVAYLDAFQSRTALVSDGEYAQHLDVPLDVATGIRSLLTGDAR